MRYCALMAWEGIPPGFLRDPFSMCCADIGARYAGSFAHVVHVVRACRRAARANLSHIIYVYSVHMLGCGRT